jgi:benzoyl-CoA reductase subunit B
MPPPHGEGDIKLLEDYVKQQIYEVAIPALEDVCGRPFNYDRLSEILSVLREAAMMRNRCWRFFEMVPSPWNLWDCGVSIAPVFYLMGKPGTIEYYQDLEAELQARAEKGISSLLPEEKYRVYWDGWIPWSFLGVLSRKLLSQGAIPVVGRYPFEFFPNAEHIDPSRPIDTLVEQWYTHHMACGSSPEFALHFIEEAVQKYKVDGLIMYAARTCRLWNLGQLEIINEMERKYGIPGVVLEADMLDPKFFSDAQIDTRLQALFEMIDARRKVKRG